MTEVKYPHLEGGICAEVRGLDLTRGDQRSHRCHDGSPGWDKGICLVAAWRTAEKAAEAGRAIWWLKVTHRNIRV